LVRLFSVHFLCIVLIRHIAELRKTTSLSNSILDQMQRIEAKALFAPVPEIKALSSSDSHKKLKVHLPSRPVQKLPSIPSVASKSSDVPVNHLMKKPTLPQRTASQLSAAEAKPSLTKIVLKTKPRDRLPVSAGGYSTRARGPAPQVAIDLDEVDPDIESEPDAEPEIHRRPPPPKKRKREDVASKAETGTAVKSSRSKKPRLKDEYEADASDDDDEIWVKGEDEDFSPKERVRIRPKEGAVATRGNVGASERKSYRDMELSDDESSDDSDSGDPSSDIDEAE